MGGRKAGGGRESGEGEGEEGEGEGGEGGRGGGPQGFPFDEFLSSTDKTERYFSLSIFRGGGGPR